MGESTTRHYLTAFFKTNCQSLSAPVVCSHLFKPYNNPKKVKHLSSLGVNVTERIPIKIKPNKHNKKYLDTKSKKSGHLL